MGHSRACVDQIGNGLSLEQVHPTVDDCTSGEFARKSLPRTGGKKRAEHQGRHDRTAVDRYLDCILPGVALGSLK
jgi:hypothetical protein